MPRCTRSARRAALAVLFAVCIGTLPGCMTSRLWGRDLFTGESFERADPVGVERIDEHTASYDVALAPLEVHKVEGLRVQSRDGAAAWRLRAPPEFAIVQRLLGERELATGWQARITATHDVVGDSLVRADAELELTATAVPAGLGDVVAPEGIGEAARRVLATSRRNAFVFASEPWVFLPVVLRNCMARLVPGDLAAWLGDGGTLTIESFVFVGADGEPRYEPGMAVPPGADQPDLPIAEQLDLLADVSLLLRIDRGGVESFVCLRPDRLWLWGACEHRDGSLRHRSRWQIEPLQQTASDGTAAAPTPPIPGSLQLTTTRYLRSVLAPHAATWQRIALTPLTVLADVTVLLPFTLLEAWLDEDDDEDLQPVRRR